MLAVRAATVHVGASSVPEGGPGGVASFGRVRLGPTLLSAQANSNFGRPKHQISGANVWATVGREEGGRGRSGVARRVGCPKGGPKNFALFSCAGESGHEVTAEPNFVPALGLSVFFCSMSRPQVGDIEQKENVVQPQSRGSGFRVEGLGGVRRGSL